ncbi:MAG: FGGY-family carbohydrate kinase [Deltaproteobacteria bacterium]
MALFIGHDLGTGGNKAVLVDETGRILASAGARYGLRHGPDGHVEQDPADWWQAVCACTRSLLAEASVSPEDIAGIGFAGQMLALVPMEDATTPSRMAISWMDARGEDQARRITRGMGGHHVLAVIAGASPTGKDIIAKVAWLREREPAVFARTAAFLDATGYLVARATGKLVVDPTGASGTGLAEGVTWSRPLAWLAGFPLDKVPSITPSASVVGGVNEAAARDLGLRAGTPVVAGMADIPAAAVGAGCVDPGEAHLYLGTSGWVAQTSSRARSVPRAGIASVTAGDPAHRLVIGEMETAGAAVDWVRALLGLPDGDEGHARLDALSRDAEPGARGLLFAPWLVGERSPVPDASLRGAFVGLGLDHAPAHLARAVHEGIAHNLRWIADAMAIERHGASGLRVVGGGARSDVFLQIVADVTGRTIERVARPELAGAVGLALTAAVGVGALRGVSDVKRLVALDRSFAPRREHAPRHEASHRAFRALAAPLGVVARAMRKSGA